MNEKNDFRPLRAGQDEGRDTSVLLFKNGEEREFFVRGAVCWPVLRPSLRALEGCILVGGVDCDSGEVVVFEQEPFASVEAIRDLESNKVESWGVGPLLSLAWNSYRCRRFFINHVDGDALAHQVAVMRLESVQPKPWCVRVDWHDDDAAFGAVMRWAGRIKKGPGVLVDQLAQFHASPGSQMIHFPAVWALGCLVLGLERWPWRKKSVVRRAVLG